MNSTPGPWMACDNGKCSCKVVSCADFPIARITCGEWGDDYPSLRLVGTSSLDIKAEAFMERIAYGTVSEEMATANARLIAAAPDLLAALKSARNQLEGYETVMSGETFNDIQINAAIAKAEGAS